MLVTEPSQNQGFEQTNKMSGTCVYAAMFDQSRLSVELAAAVIARVCWVVVMSVHVRLERQSTLVGRRASLAFECLSVFVGVKVASKLRNNHSVFNFNLLMLLTIFLIFYI